jgi:hypothetical protein
LAMFRTLGRDGTAIARPDTNSDKEVRRLIIDPKSGALLAQVVYPNKSSDAPTLWEAWRQLHWTDQIGS